MSALLDLLKHIPAKSTLHTFLDWLINKNCYQEKYKKISDENCTDKSLFLSVVMRTQGKRPEALKDVLSNLYIQNYKNFEIILLGHKIESDNEKNLKDIIDSFPEDFVKKIRYYNVNEGSRTTPLNFGFALSKGRYITILDDDDIVYENWVEEFYKASIDNEGKIIHSYCLFQDWTVSHEGNKNLLIPLGNPVDIYCEKYNYVMQYYSNRCPTLSLAFPSFVFKNLNMHFDESLTTTEDWDYISRIANITGVKDIEKETCVYRNWINVENSHSICDEKEWKKNFDVILNKIKESPKLLPEDVSFDSYYNFLNGKYVYNKTFNHSRLYYKEDMIFSEDFCILYKNNLNDKNYSLTVKRDELKKSVIRYLRFDPTEFSNILLKNFCCSIFLTNGKVKTIKLTDCMHNGIRYGESVYFPLEDPYVVIKIPRNLNFSKIILSYYFTDDSEMIDKAGLSKFLLNKSKLSSKKILRFLVTTQTGGIPKNSFEYHTTDLITN